MTGNGATTSGRSILIVRITAGLLCAFGGAIMTWEFFRFVVVFPAASVIAAVLELPLLVIGFYLLRLARPIRPPAASWSLFAVVWGGSAAIGCALLANQGLTGLWAKTAGIRFAANWSDSLSAPLNEEVLKLCGVVMIVLAAPRVIKGPVDGLVFGALTGLGFQAAENVTYGLNNIVTSGATAPVQAVLNSESLRLATAFGSHWTMTAIAGAGIGFLVRDGITRRSVLLAVACLALAMGMHLLFDAPRAPLLLKVALDFVVVTLVYIRLSEPYLSRAHRALAGYAAAGMLTEGEATGSFSRCHRWREQRQVSPGRRRDEVLARQCDILDRVEEQAA